MKTLLTSVPVLMVIIHGHHFFIHHESFLSAAATDATVCTNQKPFKISVKSDGVEYNNPATDGESLAGSNVGFAISKFNVIKDQF